MENTQGRSWTSAATGGEPEQMVDLMRIVIHQASDLPPVVLCSPLNLDKCTSGKPELADSMSWWVGDSTFACGCAQGQGVGSFIKPLDLAGHRGAGGQVRRIEGTRRRSRTRPGLCK